MARKLFLLDMAPYDRATEGNVTLRVASEYYVTSPTDAPANADYDGVLTGWRWERDAYGPGRLGGASLPGRGAFEVLVPEEWVADGTLDAWLGYAWDGHAFTLRSLPRTSAYADATVEATGTMASLEQVDRRRLRVTAHDRAEDFRRPIQPDARQYSGAGGFDGTAELAGLPRPLVFGRRRNVEAVMVDPANLWLDVHDGQVEEIEAVRDNGVALVADVANPPAAGKYYVDLANGRIRLGSVPAGAVTVDAKGAAPGGVWLSTLADIVRHLAVEFGGVADPAGLDEDALADLATDRPGTVGFSIGAANMDLAEVLDRFMGGAGGFWYFSRLDLFTARVLRPATATSADDAQIAAVITDYDVDKDSMSRTSLGIPPHKVVGRYDALGLVQRADELASGVSAADRQRYSTASLGDAVAEDPDILTAHRRSVPLEVETCGYAKAYGETVAADLLALLQGDLIRFRAPAYFGAFELDAELWLAHPDYGIAAGQAVRLVGQVDDETGVPTLEVLRCG